MVSFPLVTSRLSSTPGREVPAGALSDDASLYPRHTLTVPRVPRVDLSTFAPPRSASDSLLTAVWGSSRFLEKTHQPIRDSVAATAA